MRWLRWLLGLQELIKCGVMASAPPTSGDAALLFLFAGLVFAQIVLDAVLILAGLAGFVLARLVFAGFAQWAVVFVAGGVLLLLAGALAMGA